MTVKCLDNVKKDVIVDLYRVYGRTITSLAKDFNVSRRTVYRVLAEQGITFTPPEPCPKPKSLLARIADAVFKRHLKRIPFNATQP
jgi:transposase-like protein